MHSNGITFNEFVEKHMEKQDLESLKSWLLVGFEKSDFDPFDLDLDPPSAAVQLQQSFAKLESYQSKEFFKTATIRATSEWHSGGNYKPETLKQLVLLAAYIRASGIVDTLRVLIESGALDGLTTDAYEDTVQYVVGVLQGFASLPEVEVLFEHLFDRDDFAPFATQLFLGLCECNPKRYTDYVPRFLELHKSHPDDYSMFHVMHGLVRVVSLRTIAQNFHNLVDRDDQEDFLEFLCTYPWSPCRPPRFDRNGTTRIIDNDVPTRDPSEPFQQFSLSIDLEIMSRVADLANDEELAKQITDKQYEEMYEPVTDVLAREVLATA